MVSFIIQQIILGFIQGVVEWLPLSSEGFIVLFQSYFFSEFRLDFLIHTILFLHLGTFLAAMIYFRKRVCHLTKALFHYRKSDVETKSLLRFLLVSTAVTGFVGLALLKIMISFEDQALVSGRFLVLGVGFLLLLTAAFQFKAKSGGSKTAYHLSRSDSLVLGLVQGFAVLPGVSRSGITSSILLLRDYDKKSALTVSFLMSLPVVLLGNLFLYLPDFTKIFSYPMLLGVLFAFLFGILTIHLLLKLSERINFSWFVLIFAILTIASGVFII